MRFPLALLMLVAITLPFSCTPALAQLFDMDYSVATEGVSDLKTYDCKAFNADGTLIYMESVYADTEREARKSFLNQMPKTINNIKPKNQTPYQIIQVMSIVAMANTNGSGWTARTIHCAQAQP